MASPITIHWGILATGGIAETFTRDLLVDPKTRGVEDIIHTVVAVASSSSSSSAQKFIDKVGAPSSAKAYGSYAEFVHDPNVEMVYVATPHSHHFQNVMLCLEAGKNVLCEKAFTVNAAQTKLLVKKAREKNLFLMEAVWTRYFPLSIHVRELIASNALGPVHRVVADLSVACDPEQSFADGQHRMVNRALAGGPLLDLGIYALTWCFQTLYHTQLAAGAAPPPPPTVAGTAMTLYPPTGADEQTTILLHFPRGSATADFIAPGGAHAVATTSLRVASDPDKAGSVGPSVRIQGEKGEAQVFHPIYRPSHTKVVYKDGRVEERRWPQPGPGEGSGWFNGFAGAWGPEGEGHGMFWEADEAGKALVEGRKEGRFCGLEESVVVMEVMDEVRRRGGLVYPEGIESTEYPLNL